MKRLLWVKTDFLHPTTRGGQIRTLEMLKRLHQRHEVHYVAFDNPEEPEGLARSGEYCSHAYPVAHHVPARRSVGFARQLAAGLVSSLPVSVSRYTSRVMRAKVAELEQRQRFDAIVCDFLAPAENIPDLSRATLFQHNVEAQIWQRHAATATQPLIRAYMGLQARRMQRYERRICQTVRNVVAVSEADAKKMQQDYQLTRTPAAVATGVDLSYFTPTAETATLADLIFVGSMDWMPNTDGINWFLDDILPLIRQKRPDCRIAVVGRSPTPEIKERADSDPLLTVTGTVPDVRPWLWGSTVSIVPLRIGGGTRLKIYEAMAARVPVVSTTIGAEGLDVRDGETISLADTPESFAARCLELLENTDQRKCMSRTAWDRVSERFSWDAVTDSFERFLWN